MNIIAEQVPVTRASRRDPAPNDYDLVCELMHRQEAFQRCDQYIFSPEFPRELQDFWKAIRRQEASNLKHLQERAAGKTHGWFFKLTDLTVPLPNHQNANRC